MHQFLDNRVNCIKIRGTPSAEPLSLKDFKLKATLGRGAFGKVVKSQWYIIKVYFRYRSSWLRESGRRPSVPLRLLKRRFVFRSQLAKKRLSLLSRWSLRTTTSTSRCWKEMFLPLAAVVVASNAGCDDNNEDSSIMNNNQSQSYYESKMARNHCHHHFHLWPPRFLTGLHASFQDNERLFFVMDFLGGGDLMHHMMQVSLENPEEIQIPRVNDLENQEPDSTLQRSSLLSSSSTTRLARLAPYHKARRYWLRELWCWPHIGRFFSLVFRWFCWFALLCLLYDIHVSTRGCLPSWIISRDKRLKVNEAVKVRESLIIKNMWMLKFWQSYLAWILPLSSCKDVYEGQVYWHHLWRVKEENLWNYTILGNASYKRNYLLPLTPSTKLGQLDQFFLDVKSYVLSHIIESTDDCDSDGSDKCDFGTCDEFGFKN